MPLQGTLVNIFAIILGALLGRYLGHFLPDRMRRTIMSGLGLAVVLVGLGLAFETEHPIVVITSLVLGGIIGESLDLEARLEKIGQRLQKRFSDVGKAAEAFVTASLLYCVGAMAIMGSIQDGLGSKPTILYAKAALDGVASVALASTLGIGVVFSVGPVFLYQGAITIAASSVQGYLTETVIREMNAVGGLLIFGIALDLLGIKRLPVGNLLPGIFVAAFLAGFF